MSDNEVTRQTPDPDGLRCPAALPLCACGVRGCDNARAHAQTHRRKGHTWARRTRS